MSFRDCCCLSSLNTILEWIILGWMVLKLNDTSEYHKKKRGRAWRLHFRQRLTSGELISTDSFFNQLFQSEPMRVIKILYRLMPPINVSKIERGNRSVFVLTFTFFIWFHREESNWQLNPIMKKWDTLTSTFLEPSIKWSCVAVCVEKAFHFIQLSSYLDDVFFRGMNSKTTSTKITVVIFARQQKFHLDNQWGERIPSRKLCLPFLPLPNEKNAECALCALLTLQSWRLTMSDKMSWKRK